METLSLVTSAEDVCWLPIQPHLGYVATSSGSAQRRASRDAASCRIQYAGGELLIPSRGVCLQGYALRATVCPSRIS